MTERDELLRAAVYRAFEAKGNPEFREACVNAIIVHRTWPLIRYAHAIETGLEMLTDVEAGIDAAMIEVARGIGATRAAA